MRNPVRYKLYILTEGICLNYKGVPLLFTKKQIEAIICSLCYERIIETSVKRYNNGVFIPCPPRIKREYWYDKFVDGTYASFKNHILIPAHKTALEELNIPLRLYSQAEFYIDATRRSHKKDINTFNHAWQCDICRYKLPTGSCYCSARSSWYPQNAYNDFKSLIINTLS